MFPGSTMPIEVNARTRVTLDITSDEAFRILCRTLRMEFLLDDEYDYYLKVFDEDLDNYDPYYDQPCVCYVDKDGEEKVIDERGNMFAALCTLVVNMYPNVSFRSAPWIYRYDPRKDE